MNLTEEQKEKIKLKLEEEHKVSEASSKEKIKNEILSKQYFMLFGISIVISTIWRITFPKTPFKNFEIVVVGIFVFLFFILGKFIVHKREKGLTKLKEEFHNDIDD